MKSHTMIGYPSGQDGMMLPGWDCPFRSQNKISLKSKKVHESFLFRKIFSVTVKRFSVISLLG